MKESESFSFVSASPFLPLSYFSPSYCVMVRLWQLEKIRIKYILFVNSTDIKMCSLKYHSKKTQIDEENRTAVINIIVIWRVRKIV